MRALGTAEKRVHRHGYVLNSAFRGVVGKAADCFTGSKLELVVFVLLYLLTSQSWQFLQALFNRENTILFLKMCSC